MTTSHMPPFFLGCPVWSCAGWKGQVYPASAPQKSWLKYYSETFLTVEGNTTFYAIPSPDTVQRWIAQVVQAAIGGKIIARETIKGFKKDVLTKIHGGGATDRKRKLLEKQKKGKARSKQFGRVEIPQEAFIGVLKIQKE